MFAVGVEGEDLAGAAIETDERRARRKPRPVEASPSSWSTGW